MTSEILRYVTLQPQEMPRMSFLSSGVALFQAPWRVAATWGLGHIMTKVIEDEGEEAATAD
jgi:hypothetical protein